MKKLILSISMAVLVASGCILMYSFSTKSSFPKKTGISTDSITAPTSCTSSSAIGSTCTINCSDPKTANCTATPFKATCECIPKDPPVTSGDITLSPNHKFNEVIQIAQGFGSTQGDEFANALSANFAATSQGSWNLYYSTADFVENAFENLSNEEKNTVLAFLLQ